MTKKQNYEAILEYLHAQDNHNFDEFITGQVALLDKARKPSAKKLAKRTENEKLTAELYDFIKAQKEPIAVGDIAKHFDVSTSKISSLAKSIASLEKTKVRDKVFYAIA